MTTDRTLAEAIRMVLPHADRDVWIPVLNSVLVTSDGVLATDLYTIARVNIPTSVPEGETVIIPLAIARLGVEAINGDELTITTPKSLKALGNDVQWATVRLGPKPETPVPDFAEIFARFEAHEEPTSPGNLSINVRHLAKYAARHFPGRHRDSHHTITFATSAVGLNKPIRVTVHDFPEYESLLVTDYALTN